MSDRKAQTRRVWLDTLARHRGQLDAPELPENWSKEFDFASRARIAEIQSEKLAVLTPFLYENSAFYRRRFDGLGLLPTDFRSIEDLSRWPVITKEEMSRDAAEHPPYGTYQTIGPEEWADRGWIWAASALTCFCGG